MQLVVNTPGTFITQKDECFRLKQKDKVFDISPLKVESIVISNQAHRLVYILISDESEKRPEWLEIKEF